MAIIAAICKCSRCRCPRVEAAWDTDTASATPELVNTGNGHMDRQATCLPEGCPCHTGDGEMPLIDIELAT